MSQMHNKANSNQCMGHNDDQRHGLLSFTKSPKSIIVCNVFTELAISSTCYLLRRDGARVVGVK